jgi:DNA-binding response OmpR family regulator
MEPAVLVVEKEGLLTRALSRLKETLNLNMHVAGDALQAIALVQLHNYTALIIDSGVGFVDGWSLLRYREDNGLALPAIVVSTDQTVPVEFVREFADTIQRVCLSELPGRVEQFLPPPRRTT